MAFYVYITKECEADIKNFGLASEVNNLRLKIETEQHINYLVRFPAPFLKKRFARQHRLIASTREFADKQAVIVIFHRILTRGGKDYENFIMRPSDYGNENFLIKINEDEIQTWLVLEQSKSKLKAKPKLSEIELQFIWKATQRDKQGISSIEDQYFLFESLSWKASCKEHHDEISLGSIHNSLLNGLTDKVLSQTGLIKLSVGDTKKHEIGLCILPDKKAIMLESVQKSPGDFKHIEKIVSIYDKDKAYKTLETLSIQAYPYYFLTDYDWWKKNQDNSQYNLALSFEEKDILFDVLSAEPKSETGFPLFLNGRAGSGKSTVLQYLFAEYLSSYLEMKNEGIAMPMYLSYSEDLITIAKNNLNGLLKHSHRFLGNHGDEQINEVTLKGDNLPFKTFRQFLIDMLPEDDKSKFEESKHISYSGFRNNWNKKYRYDMNVTKKVTADLCWHVIRTYIKGNNSDNYLDKEDYFELSKSEKSVSKATFDFIYDNIWELWYKQLTSETGGHWDDLDIVRHILDKSIVQPTYSTIFCDEAQDFTSIELELLYKSSIYSDRQLSLQDMKRIPVSFAGDQFQTLNPTGFRWEAIRANYTERFLTALLPWENKSQLSLNYRQLKNNYRSVEQIVKLCNTFQAIRSLVFRNKDSEPQEGRRQSEFSPFYMVVDAMLGEHLRNNLAVHILVPCNLDEELSYFSSDEFLSQYAPSESGSGRPLNILSAMRAKGQEYEEVYVYGFGKFYLDNAYPDIETLVVDELSSEAMLDVEYFFNKLYVAISRARNKMIIVDTKEAIERFWKPFTSDDFVKILFELKGEDFNSWEKQIGKLSIGDSSMLHISELELPQFADLKMKEGKTKNDVYLLKQAGGIFDRLKNIPKTNECFGLAAEIEEDYKTAGNHFSKQGDYPRAFNNYWKGKCYKDLINLIEKVPDLSNRVESKFVLFKENPSVTTFQQLCAALNSKTGDVKFSYEFNHTKSYSEILLEGIDKLVTLKNIKRDTWEALLISIRMLESIGFYKADSNLAKIACRAGASELGVKYFEDLNDFSSLEYKEAKKKIILNKLQEGVTYFDSNREREVVIDILIDRKEKLDLAARIMQELQFSSRIFNHKRVEDLLELAIKGNYGNVEEIGKVYISTLVRLDLYSTLFRLLKLQGLSQSNRSIITKYFNSKLNYWRGYLVKEVAQSKTLPELKPEDQRPVTQFLSDHFIEDSKEIDWQVHPLVVGAAFERAGQDTKSDIYYEKCLKRTDMEYGFNSEVIMRRIKVKTNQNLKSTNIERLRINERLLKTWIDENKVSPNEIPEFPFLSKSLMDWIPGIEDEGNKTSWEKTTSIEISSTKDNMLAPDNLTKNNPSRRKRRTLKNENEGDGVATTIQPNTQNIINAGNVNIQFDKENQKLIIHDLLSNSDAKYNFKTSKWNIDDDINYESAGNNYSFEGWNIIVSIGNELIIKYNGRIITKYKIK